MLIHTFPAPEQPARVVILGAGGFLATEVAAVLARDGIALRAIGSLEIDLTSPDAADKLASALRPDDTLVMISALTPDKGRTVGTLMKNLRMAEQVCAALSRTAPAHLVYISSDSVYDARFASVLDENSTCEPMDTHALMHTAREFLLRQACQAAGTPLAVLRPCSVYGPGDTHNSYGPNRFIRTARADRKITLFGGGEERRHHIYISDVARLVALCILHRSTGVINAVTGTAVSFREVADRVASILGPEVVIECLPRTNPITHRHYNTTALVEAFPQFLAMPLDVGLAATVSAVSAIR